MGVGWFRRRRNPQTQSADANNLQSLATVWNQVVLRHGDKVVVSSTSTATRTHPNTYTIAGLVRASFREVGARHAPSFAGEVHVDGARHSVEMMQTMAGLVQRMYSVKERQLLDRLPMGRGSRRQKQNIHDP